MAAIDVGAAATDRGGVSSSSATYISVGTSGNAANATGILDSIEIYAVSGNDLTGCKIGTFYGSDTSWTSRDYESIGSVTGGSKQTFSGLDCGVQTGDFLGIYFASGQCERDTTGQDGLAYKTGDQFGTGMQTYTIYSGDAISVYGTGATTDPPTVTTQAVTLIVPGGGTFNGNITDDGGAAISEHGFCWKDGGDPVNIAGADGYSELGAGAEGAFDQAKTGLAEATEFYLRAYATNSEGDGYGDAVSFTTGQTHSGVVAITPALAVEAEGHRIAGGVVAVGPAVGIVTVGHRIAGGVVAVGPEVDLTVDGNRLAAAIVAIVAGVDLTAVGDVFKLAASTIGIEAGVSAAANVVRGAVAAIGPGVDLTARANFLWASASAAITPELGIVLEANRIAGAIAALGPEIDVEAIGGQLVEAGVDITVATDLVAIASMIRGGDVSITPAAAIAAAAVAIFSGQVALTPAVEVASIAHRLASAVVDITPAANIETIGNYITLAAAALAVEAAVSGRPTKVILAEAGITVSVSVSATATKYIFIALGLSGDLGAGSVLQIDSEKMTFKLDGINALKDMVGDFFNIPPGDSTLEYDDDEIARDVDVDVTYTPRDA